MASLSQRDVSTHIVNSISSLVRLQYANTKTAPVFVGNGFDGQTILSSDQTGSSTNTVLLVDEQVLVSRRPRFEVEEGVSQAWIEPTEDPTQFKLFMSDLNFQIYTNNNADVRNDFATKDSENSDAIKYYVNAENKISTIGGLQCIAPLSVRFPVNSNPRFQTEFECVPVYRLAQWPDVAEDVFERDRKNNWISQKTIDILNDSGCFVCSAGDVWTYNFEAALDILLLGLDSKQKNILEHVMRNVAFQANEYTAKTKVRCVVEETAIKHTFCWTLDGVQNFEYGSLSDAQLGRKVLDKLLSLIDNDGYIPNYFCPDSSIACSYTSEFVANCASTIEVSTNAVDSESIAEDIGIQLLFDEGKAVVGQLLISTLVTLSESLNNGMPLNKMIPTLIETSTPKQLKNILNDYLEYVSIVQDGDQNNSKVIPCKAIDPFSLSLRKCMMLVQQDNLDEAMTILDSVDNVDNNSQDPFELWWMDISSVLNRDIMFTTEELKLLPEVVAKNHVPTNIENKSPLPPYTKADTETCFYVMNSDIFQLIVRYYASGQKDNASLEQLFMERDTWHQLPYWSKHREVLFNVFVEAGLMEYLAELDKPVPKEDSEDSEVEERKRQLRAKKRFMYVTYFSSRHVGTTLKVLGMAAAVAFVAYVYQTFRHT